MAEPCVRCGKTPPSLHTLSPREDWVEYLDVGSDVLFLLCDLCYEEAELLARAETRVTSGPDDLLIERTRSFLDDISPEDLVHDRRTDAESSVTYPDN